MSLTGAISGCFVVAGFKLEPAIKGHLSSRYFSPLTLFSSGGILFLEDWLDDLIASY